MKIKRIRKTTIANEDFIEVNTEQELLECDLCRGWYLNGYTIAFDNNKAISEGFILALKHNVKQEGECELRVIGYVDTEEDKKKLEAWLPDRNTVRARIKIYGTE